MIECYLKQFYIGFLSTAQDKVYAGGNYHASIDTTYAGG